MIDKGEYVLATKYGDGDPADQWCVGFYDRLKDGRHYVTDGEGHQYRGNGFRRAQVIASAEGEWLLAARIDLERMPPGANLWELLAARNA